MTELAWAAGFFDAEGSTVTPHERGVWRRFRIQVPQNVRAGGRGVLERFMTAVESGRIAGPDAEGLYTYYTSRTSDAVAVLRRLLPRVGPVKRIQATLAARRMIDYLDNTSKAIGPRSVVRRQARDGLFGLLAHAADPIVLTEAERIAWAAGVFDGDGCFTTTRSHSNPYPILSASVGQSDANGVPDLLIQIRDALRCGRIGGPKIDPNPNALPQYEWVCATRADVHAVFATLSPYLSGHKHRQFFSAVETYQRHRDIARTHATTAVVS